jgi:hypothetical protein
MLPALAPKGFPAKFHIFNLLGRSNPPTADASRPPSMFTWFEPLIPSQVSFTEVEAL